ncbi:glycosyltransferase family 2 protein, partial [Nanoarchaeota archaeon]
KLTKKFVNKVIVIDDGSKDNTYNIAKKNGADYVLKHIVNMGKGLALRTGFEAALKLGAGMVVAIDSDGQHDPRDIPRMIKALDDKKADIVIGARPFNKKMPLLLKFGNGLILLLFKMLFGLNVKDTQSGYRLFKADVYNKIKWKSCGYEVETEMLANAGKFGLKVVEVPIKTVYHDKHKGTTPIHGVKIILKMIKWKLLNF